MRQDLNRRLDSIFVGVNGKAAAFGQSPERIGERAFAEAWGRPRVSKLVVFKCGQDFFVFGTRHKLQFAELHRLKTAGGIEFIAKLEKADRRHRFENVDLRHQYPLDRYDATKAVICPKYPSLIQPFYRRIDLVKYLLEP